MKHLTTTIVVAVVLVVLLPAAGQCQTIRQKSSKYYASLRAGAFFPDRGEFDDGFSGEVSIGVYLSPNLAIEGSLGVVWIGDFNGSIDTVFGPVPADIDVTATPLTFTVKGILPYKRTEFYLAAGGGVYFLRAEASFFSFGWPSFIDENEVVLGGHLATGFTVEVERTIFVGLEARYTSTDSADMRIANTSLDIEMQGTSLTVIAGFRF
jgi:hypothetical protein